MNHAFPEDELKPLSCVPLTRNQHDPNHFDLNDPLGNYSLTLVDSLSTLAIFASSKATLSTKRDPLQDFQNGVEYMVTLYGDGTRGDGGQGYRSRGFDLDSRVQVFETAIRGVGGLLSAHLFAVGELPITQYKPFPLSASFDERHRGEVQFLNGFIYNGQLLRLAHDLASRLLPAFYTPTALPYPRVNLRHGVNFYPNSPLNKHDDYGQCVADRSKASEITETCSAGAGSLALEFSLLSRLTGDVRFQRLSTAAFDSIWRRRTNIGLIGSTIDAETGMWGLPYTGIGAGVDSFFEYAFKTHILLSTPGSTPNASNEAGSPEYFQNVWEEARASIKRHLYRGPAFQHGHYIQSDLHTGGVRGFWIDSLSAFYPGLLSLSGELNEATETHLLYAALWARYRALPERWNVASGSIEGGLRWWGGRPEFIESTWYLFRATKDPWYLRVGEMVIRDIKERCWTPCGWAGLEDVRTGEQKDRMESFFLGETAKYLFLLFDSDHPLNHLDKSWVFTTEGHPLIMPRPQQVVSKLPIPRKSGSKLQPDQTCPVSQHLLPFGVSAIASRPDFYHAAGLARLHLVPAMGGPADTLTESAHWDINETLTLQGSRNGLTSYPWTLPRSELPANGYSARMETRSTFDLSFPTFANSVTGSLTLKRTSEGVLIQSLSGLKLSMIKEPEFVRGPDGWITTRDNFRIYSIAHMTLGRDEKVLIGADTVADLNPVDQYFTRHREISGLDLVLDMRSASSSSPAVEARPSSVISQLAAIESKVAEIRSNGSQINPNLVNASVDHLLEKISTALQQHMGLDDLLASTQPLRATPNNGLERSLLYATVAVGIGAGPLPDIADASTTSERPLVWHTLYDAGEACTTPLPASTASRHHVFIIKRGGCTFSEKLRNIPSYTQDPSALQLVIVVSGTTNDLESASIRPALDEFQYTPNGVPRPNQIPVVLVEGGSETMDKLRRATGIGIRRRYHFSTQGTDIGNLYVV